MPIPAPAPVTTEPVEAKTYPDQWISTLVVNAPSPTAGSVTIDLLPCNATTGEILRDGSKTERIQTQDLWRLIAEVPEVGAAMGANFTAVPKIREWLEAQAETLTPG